MHAIVGEDFDQRGVLVQALQLGLEQVLGDHEAGEVLAVGEGVVGFHRLVQFGVGSVGDLVDALGTEGAGHGVILKIGFC